jgi:ComF family protein
MNGWDIGCCECRAEYTQVYQKHACEICAEQNCLCHRIDKNIRDKIKIRSLYRLDDKFSPVIRKWKYEYWTILQQPFEKILRESLCEIGSHSITPIPAWDCIIPATSSVESIQYRGYHHVYELAKNLSRSFKIPLLAHALEEKRARKKQVGGDLQARFSSFQGLFRVQKSEVQNKNILFLDDVITTGATAAASSMALLEAGAANIFVLTLARRDELNWSRAMERRL